MPTQIVRMPRVTGLTKVAMLEKSTWAEFKDSQLLWWINRTLHLFGWAIVMEADSDGNITEVYPARCKFRGFDEKSESEGFVGLTKHIASNIDRIESDVNS